MGLFLFVLVNILSITYYTKNCIVSYSDKDYNLIDILIIILFIIFIFLLTLLDLILNLIRGGVQQNKLFENINDSNCI